MQTTLVDLLKTENILVGVQAQDAKDAIDRLTAVLVESGHVTPAFGEDTWVREQRFPTGLPTQPLAVAIPHADPDHVHQSSVCLGILKSPVRFAQMGTDGSILLDVQIVFLLAIKEREKQVEMIQQLVTLIQTGSLLEGLAGAKDAVEAMELIKTTLD